MPASAKVRAPASEKAAGTGAPHIKETPGLADMAPGTGFAPRGAEPAAHRAMHDESEARELGRKMNRVLRTPLAGLRASMESLGSELRGQGSDSAANTLEAALEQVTRLARDVEALVDLAAPRPVAPLGCSAEEIVLAAVRALPPAIRPRVRIAGPLPTGRVMVDGPLLAASLEHLLESALDGAGEGDWALLQVRRESDDTVFAIALGGGASILQPGSIGREPTPWDAHLDLGVALAHRDIGRMGAVLQVETTERGCTRAVVRVPAADPFEGEVA